MAFEDLAPATQNLLRQKAVTVKPLGLQTIDRFDIKEKDERDNIPTFRPWRLNLTRLSHVYNLYLVAYKDKIYVYEPTFPDQRLPAKPSLIISPPRSPSASHGYLDPECPHSINHLVVDFLGDAEIFVVACDDGDVIGYYMHNVQAAIDARRLGLGPESILADEVRPIFNHCVGSSAWGLSIHTNARKVAVSCNGRTVHVVQFGLHDYDWIADLELEDRDSETRIIVLKNFNGNLPSVSFCNTKDDPQGKLIAVGELSGLIYLYDLDHPTKLAGAIMTRFCQGTWDRPTTCVCPDIERFVHAIWGISFVDRLAFRPIPGYTPDSDIPRAEYDQHWNGSFMRLCVPDAKHTYRLGQSPHDPSGPDDGEPDEDDEDEPVPEQYDLSTGSVPGHLPASLHAMSHPWMANIQPPSRSLSRNDTGKRKKFLHRWIQMPDFVDQTVERKVVPNPLITMSKHDLVLTQPESGTGALPHIALEHPLKQTFDFDDVPETTQPPFTKTDCDRMSFHAVIPELGTLVVGSPAGRVSVFSLFRTDEWPWRKREGTHFMRQDWLLPFASQESQGLRPEAKLVGMTVGPMQGQLGPVQNHVRRRWRLMLHYANHSILSYELSLAD